MARVLVVDDAAFMRKMLSDVLGKAGHEVVGDLPRLAMSSSFARARPPRPARAARAPRPISEALAAERFTSASPDRR